MALTYSEPPVQLAVAPSFDLPIANPWIDAHAGTTRCLADYADAEALLVVFMCNHCPYAIHIEDALIALARDYAAPGLQVVSISANDADAYPQDGFGPMADRAKTKAFPFPYLYDATQAVARAYDARCTPDPFLFDNERRLLYHGRLDASRPGQGIADGHELRAALDAYFATGTVSGDQHPSMGCNIKWKPGMAP